MKQDSVQKLHIYLIRSIKENYHFWWSETWGLMDMGRGHPGLPVLTTSRIWHVPTNKPTSYTAFNQSQGLCMLSKHSTAKLYIPSPELSSVLTTAAPGTKQLINNSWASKTIPWSHSYQATLTLLTLHQPFFPEKLQQSLLPEFSPWPLYSLTALIFPHVAFDVSPRLGRLGSHKLQTVLSSDLFLKLLTSQYLNNNKSLHLKAISNFKIIYRFSKTNSLTGKLYRFLK